MREKAREGKAVVEVGETGMRRERKRVAGVIIVAVESEAGREGRKEW